MANIRKSFNFRNGVAVDDDDFIVRGSLVGIGTSVPSEIVDIRGTLKIVGTTTTRDLFSVGVATLTELTIAGTAITMNSSGIITAKEFYGNGATLLNLPTSQWQDVDVGLGFTSIYAVGNVGVATRDPRFVFQVGQANLWQAGLPGRTGVGINSQGDIISSGIFTAFSFVGFGSNLQLLDADNINLGTLNNDRLPIIRNDRFPPNVDITGIVTAGIKFSGVLEGELVGIASTARSLIGSPDIQVGFISAISIRAQSIEITGDAATPIPGISTVGGRFDVGAGGTGFTASVRRRIGIGVSQPTKNLQIDNGDAGSTFVEVASASGPAIISIAQSITGGVGNLGGFLRYGDTSGEFDIYNKSPGNFNFLLHAGSPGINTGRFNWLNGQTFANLMSLTYDGKLGIRIANPSENLHVVGTSTITGNAYFGGNIFTNGTVTIQNTILGDPTSSLGQNINVNSGVSTFNTVNIANRLGIGSALPSCQLDARGGIAVFGGLGVGVTPGGIGELNTSLFQGNVIISSTLGIGTTAVFTGVGGDGTPANQIDTGSIQIWDRNFRIESANALINRNGRIGIGTYLPIGAIDARYARTNATTRAPIYLPNMTTGERGGLASIVEEGAIIYNLSNKVFEFFDGANWIAIPGATSGAFTNLTVSNQATINGLLDANGGAEIDNIRIGIANNNEIDTSTGNLTIDSAGGTTTIDDALTVSGAATLNSSLTVAGAATFNGNVGFGNATTDTITFTSRIISNILPSTSLTRDLGSSSLRWNNVYAGQFIGDGSGLTGIVATGSGVVVQDSGSPVGTAATLNFGTNLTVSLSGGVATIDASGGGGGVSVGGTWGITANGGQTGITTVKAVGVKTDVLSSSFMVQQFGIESKAATFTASAGISTSLDVIGISTFNFRTAEYTLYFEWNGNIQSQKVLCMHNGTTAFSQEYAVMYDPNQIVSVGSTIDSGLFRLLVTPEAGVSGVTTYTWTRHTVIRT
jgi:hypothetical protein